MRRLNPDVFFIAPKSSPIPLAQRFGKRDVLIVDLRRIQSITDNGLKQDYTVERVREHRAPLRAGLLAR